MLDSQGESGVGKGDVAKFYLEIITVSSEYTGTHLMNSSVNKVWDTSPCIPPSPADT